MKPAAAVFDILNLLHHQSYCGNHQMGDSLVEETGMHS